MKAKEVVQHFKGVIDSIESVDTESPVSLLDARAKCRAELSYLSGLIPQYFYLSQKSEKEYKSDVAKSKLHFVEVGHSVARAEEEVRAMDFDSFERHISAETKYKILIEFKKSIEGWDDFFKQKISFLKLEYNNERG